MIPMYPWLKNRLTIRKSLTKKLSLKLPQTSNYGETQKKNKSVVYSSGTKYLKLRAIFEPTRT